MVDRARAQLRRFFSDASWRPEDDAALAALIGPGDGWTDTALATDLKVGYGWRAGSFRIDVALSTADAPSTPEAVAGGGASVVAAEGRTLGDTFEATMVLEAGTTANEARFVTGPGTGGFGTFTRESLGNDARVATLFAQFAPLTKVQLGNGTLSVTIDDEAQWPAVLLALFDAVQSAFVPSRPAPPDRQLERARAELGTLQASDARDFAKLIDATTSPDAAFRRVAVARLGGGDPTAAQRAWSSAFEDTSRVVRRAAIRAIAGDARPEVRHLLERAVDDKDPCLRYYGVRGLAAIGSGPSASIVDRHRRDPDLRVRIAVQAAAEGRLPA